MNKNNFTISSVTRFVSVQRARARSKKIRCYYGNGGALERAAVTEHQSTPADQSESGTRLLIYSSESEMFRPVDDADHDYLI